MQYDFVANCSAGVWVSWKIGKVEKEKALNRHKQESSKKGCLGKYTEGYSTGTFKTQSNI